MLGAQNTEDWPKTPKMSDEEKSQRTSTDSQRFTRASGKSKRKAKQSFAATKFVSETDDL